MSPNFSELWEYAIKHFQSGGLGLYASDHGPEHWRRVEENARNLADKTGADSEFVRLFAIIHDSCRENEMADPEHGQRASVLVKEICDKRMFGLNTWAEENTERFDRFLVALIKHDKGETSRDTDTGTCWDADRLDLTRVGIAPMPSYFSTDAGRHAAIKKLTEFLRTTGKRI